MKISEEHPKRRKVWSFLNEGVYQNENVVRYDYYVKMFRVTATE